VGAAIYAQKHCNIFKVTKDKKQIGRLAHFINLPIRPLVLLNKNRR
jgi:hypothetical protein